MIKPKWLADLAREAEAPEPHMDTPCWLWNGRIKPDGYGAITVNRREKTAHREIYMRIKRIVLLRSELCCHRCDVRHCVRPSHIFVGSAKQNQEDMARKNRSSFGHRSGLARFKKEDALEIVRLYMSGEMNQSQLAEKYGVVQTVISDVVTGATWSRVTGIIYKKKGRARAHHHRVVKRMPVGAAHHSTPFTEDDVRAIRKKYEEGELIKRIAEDTGVSNTAISNIVHRKTWVHI